MKKFFAGVVCVFAVIAAFCYTSFAGEADGWIGYYDTAELSFGFFALPSNYDNHRFFGELRSADNTLVAVVTNDEFSVAVTDSATEVRFAREEQWPYGTYRFVLTVEEKGSAFSRKYDFTVEYAQRNPKTILEQIPTAQGQYRIFLQDFLVDDDAILEASMLNDARQMVATTYLDFSSENLVGSMLTKTPSGIDGLSYLEMITLFQTSAIPEGTYHLYFNLDEKLVSYQETCFVEAVDAPIIYNISAVGPDDFLYGENQLHPLIAGVNTFDIIVTGFQLDPKNLSAFLYDSTGARVAKNVSYQYYDTLLFGYGEVNGYQKESGIQAIVLHMQVNSSAILKEGEPYRVSLSYNGARSYGVKEAYCSPQTRFFVSNAMPYDLSSISLTFANAPYGVEYDLYLNDNTYGEIPCGVITIPEDGIVNIDVGTPLTDGQGMILGADGTLVQFNYTNDLLGLFIPQKVNVNPVVLHPTAKEFVAHFEMVNYSVLADARIDVQLMKFARQENGGYVVFDQPQPVASSTDVKSVTRARQNGYYNTHLLVEMQVNDALEESGLYSYMLTIDGHEIYLIDQGENYIVRVMNNSAYYAEILDMTLPGGLPVSQNELHFSCYGVVVADPQMLSFALVDSLGNTVATLADGSLTLLSMEAERQYCGKLKVDAPMYAGETYSLVVSYGNEILFTGEPLYGDDTADAALLVRDDHSSFVNDTEITVFSQLTNIPLNQISFSVIDLLDPYKDVSVRAVRTEYNYDTYYQYKHTLVLSEPLHEGVYKVVLSTNETVLSDAMVCVTSNPIVKSVEAFLAEDGTLSYAVKVENAEDSGSYGILLGRSYAFSEAVNIGERVLEDGTLFLTKTDLMPLSVGVYELFLTRDGIPLSGYEFYHSPFSVLLELQDTNIRGGELAEEEPSITLEFSQPLNINTVTKESFELRDPDGNLLNVTIVPSEDRRTVHIRPNTVLYSGNQYVLKVNLTVRSMCFGQLQDTIVLPFVVSGNELPKIDYFLSAVNGGVIRSETGFALSFLQDSFEEDVLLGVWSEDVSVDLSNYRGLNQCGFVVEITDYQGDKRFGRAADLIYENFEDDKEKTYLLLRYDQQTKRYLQESVGVWRDNKVHAIVRGCGRYVLCLADALPFEDVIGTWSEEYVKPLWHNKVVSGYSTTSFMPDAPITRSEFVKMLISTLGVPTDDDNYALTFFKDYGKIEEWALPYWAVAYRLNIIKGTSSNTLSPNDAITRAEMITMIGRAMVLNTAVKSLDFSDAERIPSWAQGYFSSAAELGIIGGYTDGSIRPENAATRAETAKIMCELLNI